MQRVNNDRHGRHLFNHSENMAAASIILTEKRVEHFVNATQCFELIQMLCTISTIFSFSVQPLRKNLQARNGGKH